MVAQKIRSSSLCQCGCKFLLDSEIKYGFSLWDREIEREDVLDMRIAIEEFLTERFKILQFDVEFSYQLSPSEQPIPDPRLDSQHTHTYKSTWKICETGQYVEFKIMMDEDEEFDLLQVWENLENPILF